jgi:hypothetical protein
MNQAVLDDHKQFSVLTEQEARALLRLSKITLLRMRQLPDAGGLPFVQLSQSRIGYRLSDIDAYLAARRVGWLTGEIAATERSSQFKRSTAKRSSTSGQ